MSTSTLPGDLPPAVIRETPAPDIDAAAEDPPALPDDSEDGEAPTPPSDSTSARATDSTSAKAEDAAAAVPIPVSTAPAPAPAPVPVDVDVGNATEEDPWLAAVHEQARFVSIFANRSKLAQHRLSGLTKARAATERAVVAKKEDAAGKAAALASVKGILDSEEAESKKLNGSATVALIAAKALRDECARLQNQSSNNLQAAHNVTEEDVQKAVNSARERVKADGCKTNGRRKHLKKVLLKLQNLTALLISVQEQKMEDSPQRRADALEDKLDKDDGFAVEARGPVGLVQVDAKAKGPREPVRLGGEAHSAAMPTRTLLGAMLLIGFPLACSEQQT